MAAAGQAPVSLSSSKSPFELKMEYWSKMRELIAHEDTLVNHRVGWLLGFEAFAMAGFFAGEGYLLTKGLPWNLIIGGQAVLFVVMCACLWMCFISGQTISSAYRQIASVHYMWIERYPKEKWEPCVVPGWFFKLEDPRDGATKPPDGSEFPPIHGAFKGSKMLRTQGIPVALFLINLLAAAVTVALGITAYLYR